MRQFLMAALLLLPLAPVAQPQTEPTVRIGLTQNASTVTVRSAMAFTVEQHSTRAATFTTALALDPAAAGALKKSDLQYRLTVELDGGAMLVVAARHSPVLRKKSRQPKFGRIQQSGGGSHTILRPCPSPAFAPQSEPPCVSLVTSCGCSRQRSDRIRTSQLRICS